MKQNETEEQINERLLKLLDTWQVEQPGERFFINLPAAARLEGDARGRPWWRSLPVPLAAAGAMALFLAFGLWQSRAARQFDQRLVSTASEWSAQDCGWEQIDQVIAEARQDGASDLYRDFAGESLMKGTQRASDERTDLERVIEDVTPEEMELLLQTI